MLQQPGQTKNTEEFDDGPEAQFVVALSIVLPSLCLDFLPLALVTVPLTPAQLRNQEFAAKLCASQTS
jgi:hypothetical protein